MPSNSWQISRTKQRRTTTTPAGRKSIQHCNVDDIVGLETTRKKRQSTLTQIDFVRSSLPLPKCNDEELEALASPPRSKPTRLSSKDATLTQMGLLRGPAVETSVPHVDDTMLGISDDKENHLWVDGLIESDMKKEKTPISNRKRGPARSVVGRRPLSEGYEHRPSKRRKTEEHDLIEKLSKKSVRRTRASTGILPAGTDDKSPTKIFQKQSVKRSSPAPRPPLMIRDSTDFRESQFLLDTTPVDTTYACTPVTPKRRREEVPSSQSPESIKPTTRTTALDTASREPLRNLQIQPRSSSQEARRCTKDITTVSSPKRNVCALKLSKTNALPKPNPMEDSQHDLWSLQATSSPTSIKSPRTNTAIKYGRNLRASEPKVSRCSKGADDLTGKPEMDHPNFLAQDSLPDLTDLFGSITAPSRKQSPERTSPSSKISSISEQQSKIKTQSIYSIPVRADPNYSPTTLLPEEVMLLDNEPINVIPCWSRQTEHSDGFNDDGNGDEDLGPAVANDTQFATDLIERLSSPSSSNIRSGSVELIRTVHKEPTRRSIPNTPSTSRHVYVTPMPRPKLVQSSTGGKSDSRSNRITGLESSPSTPSRNNENEGSSVTKIPLNDTAQAFPLSSQPKALLRSRAPQPYIFPASMPHPSQISTQAPSQGEFPSSAAAQIELQRRESALERITIEDTSSPHSHRRRFPSQDLSVPQVDDSDDDEFDLEVTSFTQQRNKLIKQEEELSGDETQTPTQRDILPSQSQLPQAVFTQESPIILKATTRSQRDRDLEVVPLISSPVSQHEHIIKRRRNSDAPHADFYTSSSPSQSQCHPTVQTREASHTTSLRSIVTKSPNRQVRPATPDENDISNLNPTSPSLPSSPTRLNIPNKYPPIEGFNNETQSDYTQGGHITAAFVQRCWEDGTIPRTFIPKPYKTGSGKW